MKIFIKVIYVIYTVTSSISKNYGQYEDLKICNLIINNPHKEIFNDQYDGGPLVKINNCIFSSGGMFNTPKLNNQSMIF